MKSKSVSILIVDDEPDNFDVIEGLLKIESVVKRHQYEYILHYASSGQKAIDGLSIYQPDVILLDVMMPGIDGITACRQIKDIPEWSAVPIIMITALNSKTTLAHCLDAGADDFISKPVDSMELRARVNSCLRIKHQFDEIQSLMASQQNVVHCLNETLQVLQSKIITTLAHELNTPVQGIKGSISVLYHYLDRMSPEEIQELLECSEESVDRLEALIQRILSYLDIELKINQHATLPVVKTEVSQSSIQSYIQETLKKKKKFHQCSIKVDTSYTKIPEEYLKIIIQEITDNAFKFSSPDSTLKISSEIKQRQLYLAFQDHGRGMSQIQINKINTFMQFERGKYEQQGLGLGLMLVKKILDYFGGELDIRSIYQHGTTITISIPLSLQD